MLFPTFLRKLFTVLFSANGQGPTSGWPRRRGADQPLARGPLGGRRQRLLLCRSSRQAPPGCRPFLQVLEDRWLPSGTAVLTVNSLADTSVSDHSNTSNQLTLRDAILLTNGSL